MSWGIVIDTHEGRVDDYGIPGRWDGWYSSREYAEGALRYWRKKFPGALLHLVEAHETERAPRRGAR